MNLKEIKNLIDNKTAEVREAMGLVQQATVNSYRFEHGTELLFEEKFMVNAPHEFTVEELMERIEALDRGILHLKSVLSEKNQKTKITYNGEKMSLSSAIALLKTMRNKLPLLSRLSSAKENRNVISPGRYNEDTKTYLEVSRPAFDVIKVREELRRTEMEILKLQSLIDAANLSTNANVDLSLFE